jgi:hypothetical protein
VKTQLQAALSAVKREDSQETMNYHDHLRSSARTLLLRILFLLGQGIT